MNPVALPPMACEGTLEGRCLIGQEAQHMGLVRPTDIMLGRGPTFYNNQGNRALRKLVKEHVIFYKNKTRRRDKTALAKLIVAKLQAQGCRFLHQTSVGTWVEAPSKIAQKKVSHGLRDARLAADKNGGNVKVLWKNFRPAITKQKSDQVTTVATGEVKTTEDLRSEKPDNMTVMTMGVKPSLDAKAAKLLHESSTTLVPSNSVSKIHDGSDDAGLSHFDHKVDEDFKHLDSDGDVNGIMEPWQAQPVAFRDFKIEDRPEDSEQGGVYLNVSPDNGATNDDNAVDAVGVALNMYADVFYKGSFLDFSAGEPSPILGCPLYDGQRLCRWFSNLP